MDVQTLIDDAVFAHADAALALHDAVGDAVPHIDLEAGRVVYVDVPGQLSFAMQAIGIEYPVAGDAQGSEASPIETLFGLDPRGEWAWAWSRADTFPRNTLRLATLVREVAERHGVDDLSRDRVPLGELSAAHLVIAAKTIAGCVASIVVPGPAGTRVHLALDLRPQTPGARQASTAITAALRQGLVGDHARALRSYAEIARLPLRERPGVLEVIAPDGRLEVSLDDHQRIVRVVTCDVVDPEPTLALTESAAKAEAEAEAEFEAASEGDRVASDAEPEGQAEPTAATAPRAQPPALAPPRTEGPIAPMPVLDPPATPPRASEILTSDDGSADAFDEDTVVMRLTAADRRALREGRTPPSLLADAQPEAHMAALARVPMPRRVELGSMPRLRPRADAAAQ